MSDEKLKTENTEIEEIDPDFITGGADVVSANSTKGLQPTLNTQKCNCGEYSPNESGLCGPEICDNCIHARKNDKNSPVTYCTKQFITIS